jgi:hypothetical protein
VWSDAELFAVLVAGDVSRDVGIGVALVDLCDRCPQITRKELDLSLGLRGSGLEVVDAPRLLPEPVSLGRSPQITSRARTTAAPLLPP